MTPKSKNAMIGVVIKHSSIRELEQSIARMQGVARNLTGKNNISPAIRITPFFLAKGQFRAQLTEVEQVRGRVCLRMHNRKGA
jgi:hypothetical protein